MQGKWTRWRKYHETYFIKTAMKASQQKGTPGRDDGGKFILEKLGKEKGGGFIV
jgi:hypothetical protein